MPDATTAPQPREYAPSRPRRFPQPTALPGENATAVGCALRPRERSIAATSQGHPRTALRRALERGNLAAAEIEARGVGLLELGEALELTALIALRDRERGRRYALRWLARWLEEADSLTIDEAALVAGALAALGGPCHGAAVELLRAL